VCRAGLVSKWGDFEAEGIVARPAVELKTRAGERIITKLKTRDFHANIESSCPDAAPKSNNKPKG